MRVPDFLKRLTGFSTPLGGLSWQGAEPESAAARRVITFLEDRRVLYAPDELEQPRQCVGSVQQIREFLTTELGRRGGSGEFSDSLRAMRAAARKFLNTVEEIGEPTIPYVTQSGHWASWKFYSALGELRGVYGIHLARLADHYQLHIEDDLARILPIPDE